MSDRRFATGGVIIGPTTGDRVPKTWIDFTCERVITADLARLANRRLLEEINSGTLRAITIGA